MNSVSATSTPPLSQAETLSIKPGSLVFIKRPTAFYKSKNQGVGTKQRLFSNLLTMVSSVNIKKVHEDDETYKRFNFSDCREKFSISILLNEDVWNTRWLSVSNVSYYFDNVELPGKNVELDIQDRWLTEYYGGFGQVYIARKDFYARLGNSEKILNNRNSSTYYYKRNFFIKRGEKFVGYNVRRSAGRRVLIFNFFVNNNLCWFEFEEKGKSKSKRKVFEDYFRPLKK